MPPAFRASRAIRRRLQSLFRGAPATARGRALTGDDRFRRDIIERLMCDLSVDLDAVAARHDRNASDLRVERNALAQLEADGLVVIDGRRLTIPDEMRAGVRLACAAFDSYLTQSPARHAAAV